MKQQHADFSHKPNKEHIIRVGTPLLSVVQVIRTRCSGPLIWQMSMMSLINGILWLVYGLVRSYTVIPELHVLHSDLTFARLRAFNSLN